MARHSRLIGGYYSDGPKLGDLNTRKYPSQIAPQLAAKIDVEALMG
jgi:hypothetical protein